MSNLAHIVWSKLTGLMPGELNRSELSWLLIPQPHPALLSRRRATMVVNRVRLFAFLFAVLTPLWSVVDYVVFNETLWLKLAILRFGACIAFVLLLFSYRPRGDLPDAYRSMAILFAIPTLFYITSHQLLVSIDLTGFSAAIGAGYAFLPFVLLAGLSIFPLTLIESLCFAAPILLAQIISGLMSWPHLDWPTFSGAFWLLTLLTGVSTLAGMSQLAFMIALVRQAIRDPLTGIFSRRSGEETLEMQFTIARRADAPLSLAFFDLDHFKSVNDQFGHDAGDGVLATAAQAISRDLRRGDMLVRWGGEEFLLIMPNTEHAGALGVLERLRQQGFGLRPDGTPVTASVGLAERKHDSMDDWKPLIDLADQRMYQAKEAGRDRIVGSADSGSIAACAAPTSH